MTAIRRTVPVLALLVALLTGCTDDGSYNRAFCQRLAEPPPGDRWVDTDLIVFVNPDATTAQVEALRASLDSLDEVARSTWVTQDEAYDEFTELWADRPDLIDAVSPEAMPPNVRVTVRGSEPGSDRRVGATVEGKPGVYRVIYRPEYDMSVIDFSVRPLTVDLSLQMQLFALDRSSIQLAEVAPDEVRDAAGVLDEFWAAPRSPDGTASAQVTAAARRIAAYYDTECE